MKPIRLFFIIMGLSALMLSACQNDESDDSTFIDPLDTLEPYLADFENQNFSSMYDALTDEVKQTVTRTEFIDLYTDYYEQMGTSSVDIALHLVDEEADEDQDTDEEETEAFETETYEATVTLDTLAEDVSFTLPFRLVPFFTEVENEDSETTSTELAGYAVDWDRSYILPQLRDGGTIEVAHTESMRGNIYDRNGEPLAFDGEMLEIGIDVGRFNDETLEVQALARLLDLSVSEIERQINQSWVGPGLFVPLKIVSVAEDDWIEHLSQIPSALAQSAHGRLYPEGERMAHLIGYIGPVTAEELEGDEDGFYSDGDLIGKRGLEQIFEERLRGQPGIRMVVNNNGNRTGVSEIPPEAGEDLHLTIDRTVQQAIFDSMTEDEDAGTAAAINPETGETLALVSAPSFDPQLFVGGISSSQYQALTSDEAQPMLNRFSSTYSPGSSFKPIAAMVGLNQDVFTKEDTMTIEGHYYQEPSFGNYRVRRVSLSDGPVDLHDALVRSDNIYFARRALEIGATPFTEGLAMFGFNSDYSFSYPIRRSQVANDDLASEVLLADTGYGQGELLVSSHHLAVMYTPILNNGNLIQPTLFVDEEQGQVITSGIINDEDAAFFKSSLTDIVQSDQGTARGARSDAVTISGKTGTAELKQSLTDENARENGWFVGYDHNEDILIAMMIESVDGRGGSNYTAEKVKDFFESIR